MRGAFNSSGGFIGAITRKRGGAIDVQLHIDAVEGQQRISGSINADGAAFTLAAVRVPVRKTTATSRASRYVVALVGGPADDDLPAFPHWDRVAIIAVSPMGRARVLGTLGDGARFAAGAELADDGTLPLHVILGRDRALTDVLAFGSDQPLESVAGTLHWATPDVASRPESIVLFSQILGL